jgi:hypothetical protein
MPKTMIGRDDVIHIVESAIEKQLASHPDFKAKISVHKKSVRKAEDDWWYVGVYPSAQLKTIYYFYDIIAQVEGDLQDEKNLKIQLVPVRPKN